MKNKPLKKAAHGAILPTEHPRILRCLIKCAGSRFAQSDPVMDNAAAYRCGFRHSRCTADRNACVDQRRVCAVRSGCLYDGLCFAAAFHRAGDAAVQGFCLSEAHRKKHFVISGRKHGDISFGIDKRCGSIEADYLVQQLSLITKTVTFVGALVMMLWYSPLMTAVAVGVTAFPLAASLLTGGKLQAAEKRVSDRSRDFTSALQDCLSGFAVVKSFRAEKEIFRLFAESTRALESEKFNRRRIKTLVGMIGAVAGILAQLGVFLIGAYLALSGYGLTPGIVIVFVNLMNFLIQPIAELPGLLASRRAALGLIGKLADALEKNTSVGGGEELSAIRHDIRLENVSFGYGGDKEILHGVSVVFEAGKAYAVVGGSGSGKSTLLNLLTAGSTDYTGNILFDGTELRRIAVGSLYELISVIQQNVFVFNASIRDNVAMFRSFPQSELDAAIRRAHLGGLIAERDEDCLCGEEGVGLSGGEKQRISIARSLLKKILRPSG